METMPPLRIDASVPARRSAALVLVALIPLLCFASTHAQQQKPRAGVAPSNPQLVSPEIERRVNALLAKMTLQEKLGQLVQYNTTGAMSATVAAGQGADLAANP